MDRRVVETMPKISKTTTTTKFPKTNSSIILPKNSVAVQEETLSPKHWKKPKDMPRRPLSAYNLFFKSERERLIASIHEDCTPDTRKGKSAGIGFAALAREIAKKWKSLGESDRVSYERQAEAEKQRYTDEISVWKKSQKSEQRLKAQAESQVTSTLTNVVQNHENIHNNMVGTSFEASDRTYESLCRILFDTKVRDLQKSDKEFTEEPWVGPNFDLSQALAYNPTPIENMSQLPNIPVQNMSTIYLESAITQQFSPTFSTTSFRTANEPKDELENFMEKMEKGLS
jgi:hypothetical protein